MRWPTHNLWLIDYHVGMFLCLLGAGCWDGILGQRSLNLNFNDGRICFKLTTTSHKLWDDLKKRVKHFCNKCCGSFVIEEVWYDIKFGWSYVWSRNMYLFRMINFRLKFEPYSYRSIQVLWKSLFFLKKLATKNRKQTIDKIYCTILTYFKVNHLQW